MKTLYKVFIMFPAIMQKPPIIGEFIADDEQKAIETAKKNHAAYPEAEITLFKIADEIQWQDSIK